MMGIFRGAQGRRGARAQERNALESSGREAARPPLRPFAPSPLRPFRPALLTATFVVTAGPALAQQSVLDSKHNLSATGPGEIRAAVEQEVCVFCHTPHSSALKRQLWNRQSPTVPYTIYQSSALDAEPGQPTGSSKMCLSCHDGSIALGSVLSREQVIRMAGGITTLPPGSSNLGSDLSDDHPISFPYDSLLSSKDPGLANPHALPPAVQLNAAGELQCTTCHDAHDDTYGDFLVIDNANSALCTTCHSLSATTVPAHADCNACHTPHSAPSGPFLLLEQTVTDTCMRCHDGSAPGAANLRTELAQVFVHDTNPPVDPPPDTVHTTCSDCHEPHTMMVGPPARAPELAACLGHPRGDLGTGGAVSVATTEYQLCFRCHGDQGVGQRKHPIASRQIVQTSTRLQFEPSGPSFHPVMAPGRNSDVPSLSPGWSEGSLVLCSDCHGSSLSRKAGGSEPNGVHGSSYGPLLLARYDTLDFTPESSQAYALCYRCHERQGFGGILSDVSFPHKIHVVDSRTPCSVCHAAHGISSAQGTTTNNSHLINFNTGVVFPDPGTGMLQYVSTGRFSGSCTLSCHGVVHSPLSYLGGAATP